MAEADRNSEPQIYLLDMGRERYGDCLLIKHGAKTILVDGGHKKDIEPRDGMESIPKQLEELLGPPPFKVTGLIVTHCHSDHIGCLPEMVERGLLKPKFALVADEKLGFGIGANEDAVFGGDAPLEVKSVIAALREEDRSTMDNVELEAFLQDAARLEDTYIAMLAKLDADGAKVIRFGRDDTTPFTTEFSGMSLKLLGPTTDHLVICAEAVARANQDAVNLVNQVKQRDAALPPADIYRLIAHSPIELDALDRPGKGAAINNQSIVFSISHGGKSALFAGDMQLAKAEVTGLTPHMAQLRRVIEDAGPFEFAKLSHHTSYNGVDETVLDDFGNPKFLAHTGGWNDPGHPDVETLAMLKRIKSRIQLARTDRNKLISYTFSAGLEPSKGRLNDFTPNAGDDTSETVVPAAVNPPPPERPVEYAPAAQAATANTVDVFFFRLPMEDMKISIGGIPIEIEIKKKGHSGFGQIPERRDLNDQLASGRKIPSLLFVTSSGPLARNIGENESKKCLDLIAGSGSELLDLKTDDDARSRLRSYLDSGKYKGVVIVGGYDVVPSERVDALDPALRRQIGTDVHMEPDDFIVWSDDRYGDSDGDGVAELPVSRIPDGQSADLVWRCLTAKPGYQAGRFGIKNQERPFADAVWNVISGTESFLSCGPKDHTHVIGNDMQRPAIYFMLHGDHLDATKFWGEDGGAVEAVKIENLPPSGIGCVFAGCCWGALTVSEIASHARGAVGIRTPKQSIALSLLMSGANAFVGCTGAHYSPGAGQNFFGGPLHHSFWNHLIVSKKPPAEALFRARMDYLRNIPHGLSRPYHIGIEKKIYKQFTCLGFGW